MTHDHTLARTRTLRPLFSVILMSMMFIIFISESSAQTITFDSYSVGNIDGQDGWMKSGSYDASVSTTSLDRFAPRSLRISNAVTSGSFGDQTFSKSIVNEAGEVSAANGGMSAGARKRNFIAEWEFTSAQPGSEQPGLSISVSPDRGDGARMSWLRMADSPAGLLLEFADYQKGLGNTCASGDNFVTTEIANSLPRGAIHKIRLEIHFVEGPANDIVRVYVNGVLKHTGTSWEDYFRDCESNPTRTVDSLLFRTGGTAAPANTGKGFFIDNIHLNSTNVPGIVPVRSNALNGWAADTSAGGAVTFVNDSTAPLGMGALQILTGPTDPSRAELSRAVSVNLSDVTALSYFTKQNSTTIPISTPSYSIGVWLDGVNPSSYTNLVFEPYWNGDILPGVWQNWDVLAAGRLWASTTVNVGGGCATTAGAGGPPFYSVQGLKAACPNAVVKRISTYAGTYNRDYDVESDHFRFNDTIYDFEPAEANVVTVSPVNMGSWLFYSDGSPGFPEGPNNSLGSFVAGPGSPLRGSGSAEISVNGERRTNLATYAFANTKLSDITTLRYSTYNPSAGNGGSAVRSAYINFNVSFDGADTWQRRLVFLPKDNGVFPQNSWKEFDAIRGGNALWRFSGPTWPDTAISGETPRTWSDILASYPNIKIRETDAHMGLRVGEPYNDGYTENIDTFTFGTNSGTTIYDFEPDPLYVQSSGTANTANCSIAVPTDAFTTIQGAINAASIGATIRVCPGNYVEDVNVNKASIRLMGSGVDVSTITGPHNIGGSTTLLINASNVLVDGFTVTRSGNNATDWNSNLKSYGVVFGAPGSNSTLQNSKVSGNRNGIYVGQSSNGNVIRRNNINGNRTGIHIVDNDGTFIEENFVINNWTVGILNRSEGGPSPAIQTVRNNNISGNWFSDIEFREPVGTSNLNYSGNFLGSNVLRTTGPTGEPDYAVQIPNIFPGGTASAPSSHITITGAQSGRIDYSPYLNSGLDTQTGTPGFQGDFANVTVTADSPQANGVYATIREGIVMASSGGSVTAVSGSYVESVNVDKPLTLRGNATITGSLRTSVAGAVIAPGNGPGKISSGNLSFVSGSKLSIDLNGLTAGTQYDQLAVTGTVDLGGSTLEVATAMVPPPGTNFVIISNDGSDAVTGTFNGLPSGATVTVGIQSYTISYTGGDGNDVVLTATGAPGCNNVVIPTGIQTLPSNQVVVPLNVDNLTGRGVLSFTYTLNYNPAVLSYIGVDQAGTLSSAFSFSVNSLTPGILVVNMYGDSPLVGSGTLMNLRFLTNGAIGTSSPLNLSNFTLNEGVPCVNSTNGSVSVVSSTVSGTISYGNSVSFKPVPNTLLTGSGASPVSGTSALGTGAYTLSGFGPGAYTVVPSKSGDVNGISGLDAALISQHVVGLITLNANQMAAGDVSNNGTLSGLDAAYISQWLVGTPNPGITGTWKFVPTQRNYSNVNTPWTNQDYAAILMGELTGNWTPPSMFAIAAAPRSVNPEKAVTVETGKFSVQEAEEVTIPVSVGDLSGRGIYSYQFEVIYDPAVLEPVVGTASGAESISGRINVVSNSPEEGKLMVVAYGAQALESAGTLVNLRFRVVGRPGASTKFIIENFMFNEGDVDAIVQTGALRVVPSSTIGK